MMMPNVDHVETKVDQGKTNLLILVDAANTAYLYVKEMLYAAEKEYAENLTFLKEQGHRGLFRKRISKLRKQEAKSNKILADCKKILKSYAQ
jgi:hypothetical protein